MSKTMNIVRFNLRLRKPSFGKNIDVKKLRKAQSASAQVKPVAGVSYEEQRIADIPVDVVIPDNVREDALIYYIHGGGFISGNPRDDRVFTSFLAKESGYIVYAVDYRLAPEHPYPAGPEDCFTVYKKLAEDNPGKKIFFFGASAGATLVLVTALMARDRGVQMPNGIVAYAPGAFWDNADERKRQKSKDLVVSPGALEILQKMYAPNDADNPYVSPGYADLSLLPPLRIVWDAQETLAPDGAALAKKAMEAGVRVEAKQWEGTFHTFELLPTILPEAREEVCSSLSFISSL